MTGYILASGILIRTAMLGYARKPEFTLYAPHEPDMRTRIAWTIRHSRRVREAALVEGLDVEDVARAWEGRSRRGGKVKEARRRTKV